MGNRAVITTKKKDLGIYLHWNGGRRSVESFLGYCMLKGYRKPELDDYGWARLCQVIGNFFGGGLSIGVDKFENLDTDNGDNGTYIIEDWKIVEREFFNGEEEDFVNIQDLISFLLEINRTQPIKEQIEEDKIEEFAINYWTEILNKNLE